MFHDRVGQVLSSGERCLRADMLSVSVSLPSGQEVGRYRMESQDSFSNLARAVAKSMGVIPARCMLVTRAGQVMAVCSTPSQEGLVDGDVVTVVVVNATQV